MRYDAEVFGTDRSAFLTSFLEQEGTISFTALDAHHIKGFRAMRPARTGFRIGPPFADDRGVAQKLLCGLVSAIPGKEYFLDVPEPNTAAMAMARDLEFEERFTTARIYTGRAAEMHMRKVFGITTFELGDPNATVPVLFVR